MEKIKKFKPSKKVKGHRKISLQSVVIAIVFVIFLIYSITLIFPFVWMLINSFRDSGEFLYNVWGFPKSFSFKNYYDAAVNFYIPTQVGDFNLLAMFGISIFFTVCGTIANVLSSAVSAYVVAKYKFRGNGFLFSLSIFTMIVPIVGTMPAQYQLMDALGLINNPIGMIIVYSGSFAFNFFMLYGFFKSISWSYAEAAFVDGAGHGTVFFKIMVPIAAPALIAVAVIYAIGVWNDYTAPSLYMREIPTLAVGLQQLSDKYKAEGGKFTNTFAAMIICLLPVLIVFISFQKTIMQNTVAGGLKG